MSVRITLGIKYSDKIDLSSAMMNDHDPGGCVSDSLVLSIRGSEIFECIMSVHFVFASKIRKGKWTDKD